MTQPLTKVLHVIRGRTHAREDFLVTMPLKYGVEHDIGKETISIVDAEGNSVRMFRIVRDFYFEDDAVTVENVTSIDPVERE